MNGANEEKAEKCMRAIEASKDILSRVALKDSPEEYARAHNNLGGAYGMLASIEDKAENSKRAIAAFEQALKVYKSGSHSEDYAKTQFNMGNAYGMLASEEDNDLNCIKAFQAFMEALKVFNKKDHPEAFGGMIESIRLHLPVCEKLKRKLDELVNAVGPKQD